MFRNVLMLVVLCMFFAGFFSAAEARSFSAISTTSHEISYKMKKGDTLWKLARKYYGAGSKYTLLKKVNHIKNVRKIRTGKTIHIPKLKKVVVRKSTQPKAVNIEIAKKSVEIPQTRDNKEEAKENVEEIKAIVNETKKVEVKHEKETVTIIEAKSEHKEEIAKVAFANNSSAKVNSASDISREIQQSKLEVKAEKATLEFGPEDMMSENDPEAKFNHSAHGGAAEKFEHEASLETMYTTNKAENMKSAMADYMTWLKIPGLDDRIKMGTGLFLGAWEDRTNNDRFRGIMPGAQLGFRYNTHTPDHLMRMFTTKLMVGYEFQDLKSRPASFGLMQQPSITSSMDRMNEDPMLESESDMESGMVSRAVNSLKLGLMSEYHHELTPKSMLGVMGGGWLSSKKAGMSMEPALFASAYHIYKFGDWSWKIAAGPEYENWSNTWRLKVTPAEMGYKDLVQVGIFSDLYLWKKGEMYSGYSAQDLTTIGILARFNMGSNNMHKGHEAKDH